MRLSSFLPPTLVGLLVLGCAGDPAGPSARPISANADIAFSDRTQLIETFAYSFCADEFIPLTGTSHEVFSFNELQLAWSTCGFTSRFTRSASALRQVSRW